MWPSNFIFLSKLIFCKNLYFCQNWNFCQIWHFCQNWYFCQNLYLCQIITFDIFINRFWYNYQHLIFISIIDISINCLLEYQLVVPVNCNFAKQTDVWFTQSYFRGRSPHHRHNHNLCTLSLSSSIMIILNIFTRFTPDGTALQSVYEAFRFTESYGVKLHHHVHQFSKTNIWR